MESIKEMFDKLSQRLEALARKNAVVSPPISVGDRHVVPLCELSLGFGGGGGVGEHAGEDSDKGKGRGSGGGAGGGARITPVAVLVVDGGKVRVQVLA